MSIRRSGPSRRAVKVMELARDRGEINTSDVAGLFDTNVHDAGRLMSELRKQGYLEATDPDELCRRRGVSNRLTDAGQEYLERSQESVKATPDFGPLLAALGH